MDSKACEYYKTNFSNEIIVTYECLSRLPNNNIVAYKVLNALIKYQNVDISLSGAHSAYSNRGYIGIFWDKKYYFITSKDGKTYQIKPLLSKLTNSIALMLFD